MKKKTAPAARALAKKQIVNRKKLILSPKNAFYEETKKRLRRTHWPRKKN